MFKLCEYFPVVMWCFILLMLSTGILSKIQKGPSNSVKKLGNNVRLICKTDKKSCDDIDWTKTEGSQSSIAFYKHAFGPLNSEKFPNYVVSSNGQDGCYVDISNLSLADSGVFACTEERDQDEEKKNAVLLVIETSSCNPGVLGDDIASGDTVSISCSVNLQSDFIKPSYAQLAWLNRGLSLKSIANNETASSKLTLSYSTKTERGDTLGFQCSLLLSVNQESSLYDQGSPSAEICSYPNWAVLYPVTEITFNENREQFKKGENVLCKADGHPSPSYEWRDKAEKVVSNDESYTINGNSSLGDVFKCTATNVVKGTPHSISKSLEVVTELREEAVKTGTDSAGTASSPATSTGLMVAIVGLLLYEM